ncbi:MAG: hypothetical protein NZX77_19440 [Polyangiaceae bacterium]|nr:hypothetical protein [Polyangiaceae bacterium]
MDQHGIAMGKMSLGFRRATVWGAGGALLAGLVMPTMARAEESTPTGKGITGGMLLGAEVVVAVEAAAGVRKPLPFVLGAVAGGGLGGVGGYFLEQSVSDAKIPSYLLAAGVALLVPAAVLVFDATSYQPPAGYQEDRGGLDSDPVADAPSPSSGPAPSSPPPEGSGIGTPPAQGPVSRALSPHPQPYAFRKPALLAPPLAPMTSMLAFQGNQLHLRMPAVEIRPVFTPQELRQLGVTQREEVRIPVFQARF